MVIVYTILVLLILASAYIMLSPISIYASFDVGRMKMKAAVIGIFPFKHSLKIGKEKKKRSIKTGIDKPKVKATSKKRDYNVTPVIIDDFETIISVIGSALRLIGGILKSPDRYYLRVRLSGGLSAPDLTGGLYGGIESVKPLLSKSVSISYRPDFLAQSIEGDVTAGLVVRISSIIKEILIFGWRLPKLRLIKIYRKMRKGGPNAK
ncbi:MAG: hypothetical protein GY839_12040 [candidate division Zixibacteria bacterium]|nr:hypothetical protein [candidate division Zixibacteria bacterium]